MRASEFEKLANDGGHYRKLGNWQEPGGVILMAERTEDTPDGLEFVTMWAIGPNLDNLEVAQKVNFFWWVPESVRHEHTLGIARESLAVRDYSGDPSRR